MANNLSITTTDALRDFFAPAPTEIWSRRAFQSSIIHDDWLIIDGGEVAIGKEPLGSEIKELDYDLYPVNCTFSIPLNESWDPHTIRYNAIPKPPMLRYNFQSLFYDSKRQRINSIGGEMSYLTTDETDLSIWSFNPDNKGSGTWAQNNTAKDPPFTKGITRNFGAAATTLDGQFYSLGGYTSSRTGPDKVNDAGFVPTPGLVTYNFTTNIWTNETAVDGPSRLGTVECATLEALPLGPNGLLAVIGGDTSGLDEYVAAQNRRSMTSVSLYDPATKRWYQQETTGRAPSQRLRHCTIGVRDPTPVKGTAGGNMGTYEIYMYGGWGNVLGASAKQYDEVWILTLPAFRWIPANLGHLVPRIGHTCHLVGKSQLLSVGGQDISQKDPWNTPDTANIQGFGVFDLNTLNWTHRYNASADPYRRPSIVEEFYSGKGALPIKWTDPALESLITRNITVPLATRNTTLPAISRSKNSTSTAMITGLTTGFVCLFILTIAFILFFKRRQRRIARADALATEQRIAEYKRSRYYMQQELVGDAPRMHELPVVANKATYGFYSTGSWTARAELVGDVDVAEKDVRTSAQVNIRALSRSSSNSGTLVASPPAIRSPAAVMKNPFPPTPAKNDDASSLRHPALRSPPVAATRPSTVARNIDAVSPQSPLGSGRNPGGPRSKTSSPSSTGRASTDSPVSSMGSTRSRASLLGNSFSKGGVGRRGTGW